MSVAAEILAILREHYVDPTELQTWPNRIAVASEIDRRLASLSLSHNRHLGPHEVDYYHLLDAYAGLPGFARQVRARFPRGVLYRGIGVLPWADAAGRWFAAAVLPNGPAARAGVLAGDELLAVNGKPFAPVLSFAHGGRVCSLVVRRTYQGPPQTLSVRPRSIGPGAMLLGATRASARRLEARNGAAVGYIKPWSLAGDRHWQAVVEIVTRSLWTCARLVLDLRDGLGGASPEFAEFFVGSSPQLTLRGRDGSPELINTRWRRPLTVLIDRSTRSGSEVLAFALKRAGAMLIGTRTAGAVTAARPFLLSDASLLLVTTHRVEVDGTVLEGAGITPTVLIDVPLPYRGGVDPLLDHALSL